MNPHSFELTREFITLDSLLKLLTIAPSGGIAKMMIAAGEVEVNGETELRKTRKLRAGDSVRVGEETITIIATHQPNDRP